MVLIKTNFNTTLVLLTAFSSLSTSVLSMEWIPGGINDWMVCPENKHYVQGLCGSGKDRDCFHEGKQTYTSTGCDIFPSDEPSPDGMSAIDNYEGLNDWICGDAGTRSDCPEGKSMIGSCSGGKNKDCRDFCDPAAQYAILCSNPPKNSTHGVNSAGTWSKPLSYGNYFTCPPGEVACGACQSSKAADCMGGYMQVKCCSVNPFKVVGMWESQFDIIAPTDQALEHGTHKETAYSKTSTWSSTVTSSVKAGLNVKGLSTEVSISKEDSEEYVNNYHKEWTVSDKISFTVHFQEQDVGKHVWQWVFVITDAEGEVTTTLTRDYAITESKTQPPKCEPGYSTSAVKKTYQECENGHYLPGFEPGRRNLRIGRSA